MFEVIFSHDVDVTPKEARGTTELARKPQAGGGLEIGVEPCAEITVGFIWPCGTMRIGGCGTILDKKAAVAARLLGGGQALRGVRLDPQRDAALIEKMVLLGSEGGEAGE